MSLKMEEIKDGAEERKSVRRAWKDLAWLVVGGAALVYFWLRIASVPVDDTKFLGKDILYTNTYHTLTPGVSLPNGQTIFSPDCLTIDTKLVLTEDTLVVSNSEFSHGFKPLYTTEDSFTLVCLTSDSSEVAFTRRIKDSDEQIKENEILLYEEQSGAFIIFTAKKECFKTKSRATDKMSDSHDNMSVDSATTSVLPKVH